MLDMRHNHYYDHVGLTPPHQAPPGSGAPQNMAIRVEARQRGGGSPPAACARPLPPPPLWWQLAHHRDRMVQSRCNRGLGVAGDATDVAAQQHHQHLLPPSAKLPPPHVAASLLSASDGGAGRPSPLQRNSSLFGPNCTTPSSPSLANGATPPGTDTDDAAGPCCLPNEVRLTSLKNTVAKSIIAVELSRSWILLITLVRPLAFGQPIEVTHVPTCQESLYILGVVFTMSSVLLYSLSKVQSPVKGLLVTAAFMWAGATFSPTAATCVATFEMHPLLASASYTLAGAVASVSVLYLQSWLREHLTDKVPGIDVICQALGLLSIFIVISAASIANKAVEKEYMVWMQPSFTESYLATLDRMDVGETDDPACAAAALLPSPFLIALLWALAINGTFVRIVVSLTSQPWDTKLRGACVTFAVKFLAYFTGFQYLAAVRLGWQVALRDASAPSLSMLMLQAATVVAFAICYVTFGHPISGLAGMPKDKVLQREEVDKAFHDTTVGQTIGVSFTPLFKKLFQIICLAGGHLEQYLWPPEDEDAAAAAAYVQDWEIAAAVLYVIFIITPTAFWLYVNVILTPNDKKSDSQNAAAAADDGGGDDGGGDDGGAD